MENLEKLNQAIEGINEKSAKIESTSTEVKSLKEDLEAKSLELQSTKEELVKLGTEVSKMKSTKETGAKKSVLRKSLEEKKDVLDAIASKKSREARVDLEIKATQSYGDIDAGLDFAPMRPGITDLPKKQTNFLNLFRRVPFNGEFYKYAEQETVIRDAQNVAVCSPVTSNTKETIKSKNLIIKKIKDIIKYCIDYANDYDFVESRIRTLITDSVLFKADTDVLLGDGQGDNMNGIDFYASEFDAANADAPVGPIESANYIDLILAMQAQIYTLGQENGYRPDTVILNYMDWFSLVLSSKDADANYLDYRNVNMATAQINGMQIITSPDVPANTCYVLDSTKGEMIMNQSYQLSIADENVDDWENDLIAMKGSIRANLLVETPNQNAFMKCSDVAAGIQSITAVAP